MILDELKGEIVLIKLKSYEELETFGVPSSSVYAKVIEVDERVGIWIENPKWSPKKTAKEDQEHMTQILIRWEYVVGIMTFPDRDGFKEEAEIKPMGFVSK
jgi:hypothetical protein